MIQLRWSTDVSQDGLTECLTVQPLQRNLSPLDLIESKHQSPTEDLYTGTNNAELCDHRVFTTVIIFVNEYVQCKKLLKYIFFFRCTRCPHPKSTQPICDPKSDEDHD